MQISDNIIFNIDLQNLQQARGERRSASVRSKVCGIAGPLEQTTIDVALRVDARTSNRVMDVDEYLYLIYHAIDES